MSYLLIASFVAIVLIAAITFFVIREKIKQNNKKKQKWRDEISKYFLAIDEAIWAFDIHLNYANGYFSNYKYNKWKTDHAQLFNIVNSIPYDKIKLSSNNVDLIRRFLSYYKDKPIHSQRNTSFIQNELTAYSDFFDDIGGLSLDLQQRTAIVADEDNALVIAGAGTGKTTTIVGKVHYLIERYNIQPKDILLISFTKKSASSLASKINFEGIIGKTFHKFGKDIVALVEGRQPSIFDENQFAPYLKSTFQQLTEEQDYLNKVTDFFTNFIKPPKSEFDFQNHGDYIQYLKDKNFRTYKLVEVPTKGRTTYKMEVVKSIEECRIANFLLFNNIQYEYEFPYEHDTATSAYSQYKPDFTITQNNRKVYIEHFGVSRNYDVPHWFANEGELYETAKRRYKQKIDWARAMHESNNTTCIETFSYEMSEDILFENLTRNLSEAGIIITPKPTEEIWEIIQRSGEDEVKSLISLFQTFINLMKSNNYSINDIVTKNNDTSDAFHKRRNSKFIEIISPIYDRYQNHLIHRNEIDFSDMINTAANYLNRGIPEGNFKYVIIDEFQDISIGRYQLIKAIKSTNPKCKLFCVGDDWQSIYRFSGSDIALFKNFEDYFGYTQKSKIETTYRFHNPLIDLSTDFILKNPNQEIKELRGTTDEDSTDYHIKYSASNNQDDTNALKEVFDDLINSFPDIESKEILILGRYSLDIQRLKNENNVFQINNGSGSISYRVHTGDIRNIELNAQFLTVHKAKGLEGDIVIVLNCNSGKHGFPSEMSDDSVLNLVISEADQFENGEERRLFYVAMTRAKEKVIFIADNKYKSKFITELELENDHLQLEICPRCVNGNVVLRREGTANNGNTYRFYGCTNYLYGCEHTNTVWINTN